jgi:hypothetical protein
MIGKKAEKINRVARVNHRNTQYEGQFAASLGYY